MSDSIKVCRRCMRRFEWFENDDFGIIAHWHGKYYLIDVVLNLKGSRFVPVLFRLVFG